MPSGSRKRNRESEAGDDGPDLKKNHETHGRLVKEYNRLNDLWEESLDEYRRIREQLSTSQLKAVEKRLDELREMRSNALRLSNEYASQYGLGIRRSRKR